MNPDAIQHYIRWLSRKWSPMPFYGVIAGAMALTIFLLGQLGPAKTSNVGLARQVVGYSIPVIGGVMMAAAAYFGTRLGSWTLLARLEAGHERHYREVWYELMTKYRGFRPDVIDSARFRRLLLKLCSQIVLCEELTPEQQQWMSDLKALAEEPPKSTARSLTSEIASKYGHRILVATISIVVLVNLIRLTALWLEK